MTDPITDMLNRIRNAQAVLHEKVDIPYSDLKYEIAKILEKKGFIKELGKKGKKENRYIEIILKYEDKIPAISGLERVSRPGQRIYVPVQKIKKVRAGYGIAIISTSKGLMTDEGARKQKIGGEIICKIW